MAEIACLRRSFSNPPETSLDFSKGDPARALGESISFGRYLSEPLAWEKWSAFTQNRYLEEAEKYSKPGSVAKMKAYFEAHYGRFGARKPVAQNQAHVASSSVGAEILSSSLALNSEKVSTINSLSSVDESPANDSPGVSSYGSFAQLEDKKNEGASSMEVVVADVINSLPVVKVIQCQDTENNVKDAKENDVKSTTPQRKITTKNEAEQENPEKLKLDSMSEQKVANSLVKTSKKSNLSKLSSSLSRLSTPKKEGDGIPNSKVSMISSSLARLATPVRYKKEGDGIHNSKVSKISSSLARLATPVRPGKEFCVTSSNKMLLKESIEKKKLTRNALHMSINVGSDIDVMKKASPGSRKVGVEKVFTPLGKIIRDSSASSSTPSRVSVNSVSQYPSATPQSETRRRRVALEKSFDRSRRLDLKLKSPSIGNMKPSMQSPVTFASFSFRTEERAAKRREYFQKRLEKEAEGLRHIDKLKLKSTPDFRKSSQHRNLKANTGARLGSEVLTDNIKKIPPSRQSVKSKAKFSSEFAREKNFRSFQINDGCITSLENSKTLSNTPTMKKKRHENASPNIL